MYHTSKYNSYTTKFLKENKGVNGHDTGSGNDFLDRTSKSTRDKRRNR